MSGKPPQDSLKTYTCLKSLLLTSCGRRAWLHLMDTTLAHARLCLLHVMWMTQLMHGVGVMRLCLTLVSVACDVDDSVDALGVCDVLVCHTCVC